MGKAGVEYPMRRLQGGSGGRRLTDLEAGHFRPPSQVHYQEACLTLSQTSSNRVGCVREAGSVEPNCPQGLNGAHDLTRPFSLLNDRPTRVRLNPCRGGAGGVKDIWQDSRTSLYGPPRARFRSRFAFQRRAREQVMSDDEDEETDDEDLEPDDEDF